MLRHTPSVLVLAAAGALSATACTRASSSAASATTSTPATTEWQPVPCPACEPARLAVEVRRTVAADGRTGALMVARVRNLNAHALVVDLGLYESAAISDAEGLPMHHARVRTVLQPAGSAQAAHDVVVATPRVALAVLHGVERF